MTAMAGLLYLGLFALAAGMRRHREALLGRFDGARATRWLAPAGWVLLAASLLLAALAFDGGFALVLWFGLLPLAGGILVLSLTYSPRTARAGAILGAALIAGATFF